MNRYSRLLPSKESHAAANDLSNSRHSAPVTLHVYDVSSHPAIKKVNGVLGRAGTGAYHAGVEAYGKEWSFGSTEMGGTGVGYCTPGQNECFDSYVKAIPLGHTSLSPCEVQVLMKRLADDWQEEDYDLLRCNCCHFSAELCRQLGVDDVPNWVLNLASAGAVLDDGIQSAKARKASTCSRASCQMAATMESIANKMTSTMKKAERLTSNSRGMRFSSGSRWGRMECG